jgi:hypothetical protein
VGQHANQNGMALTVIITLRQIRSSYGNCLCYGHASGVWVAACVKVGKQRGCVLGG